MELGDLIIAFVRYALLPILTVLTSLGWYMFKRQDSRLDQLEKRASDVEKAIIRIETEFNYVCRDIKEIKDLLIKLSER